jgi:hypothetical protein
MGISARSWLAEEEVREMTEDRLAEVPPRPRISDATLRDSAHMGGVDRDAVIKAAIDYQNNTTN